jgi:hypothetical protein
MANIIDYLDWRGDIPFSVSPFNDIDNLLFTQLSFIDLEGILAPRVSGGGMPLWEAAEKYFEAHPDETTHMGLIVPAAIRTMIRRMAQCERYKNLTLAGYVNRIDENVQKQFAALTILINEREAYISYRGTDDTLVGWKENFNMSFMQAIPAQMDAVDYLNHAAADIPHQRLYVGGHSKGGNLAIYAAIHCEETIKNRIIKVYSNDGPGYRREVIDSSIYRQMEGRIVNIVPQSSVVGRLLEHDEHYTVVQSSATGLWQHDAFSWDVLGTCFVEAPALTKDSQRIERAVKKWVAEMDDAQCEKFVDSLYQVLTSSNAKTLTDLTRDRHWFWQLMTNTELTEARKTVMAGLSLLTGEAGRDWVESLKAKREPDTMEPSGAAVDHAHMGNGEKPKPQVTKKSPPPVMKSPQMIKQILTEKAGTLVKKKSEDGSNSSKKSTNQ